MDSQESNKKVKRGLELPNYTQIPNIFLDEYMRELSSSGMKVFLVICRKTLGFQKFTDAISISQMVHFTGLSNRAVIDAVTELVKFGVITKERSGSTNKYTLHIKQSEEKSLPDNESEKQSEDSSQAECRNFTPQSEDTSHTKETLKETFKEIDRANESDLTTFGEIEEAGKKLERKDYPFNLKDNDKAQVTIAISKHGKDRTLRIIKAFLEERKNPASDLLHLFKDNWKTFQTLLSKDRPDFIPKITQSCNACFTQYDGDICPECGLPYKHTKEQENEAIDNYRINPEDAQKEFEHLQELFKDRKTA